MSMTVCMRALSPVSRILFKVRMISDGSLLTGCSRLVGHSCLGRPSDVVVASMVKLSMIRRCLLSFNFAGVMLQISDVSQEMPRSALPTVLIFPFDRSRSLTNSVVELYRPIITH